MFQRYSIIVFLALLTGSFPAVGEEVKVFPACDWVDMVVGVTNVRGIAVDGQDGLISPDANLWSRLKRFDSRGRFLSNVYVNDRMVEALSADGKGYLWVLDDLNGGVVRFDLAKPDSGPVAKAGGHGAGADQYGIVRVIAAAAEGDVYVADSSGGRILHYAPDGRFLNSWSGVDRYALSKGDWTLPGLAVDSDGCVYVTDVPKKHVVVFDPKGKGVRIIGEGIFSEPTGVAVEKGGCVFVGDGNARIHIFDREGKHLADLNCSSPGIGEIKYPWGMAVDSRGDLWVADAKGNAARRFTTGRLLWSLVGEKKTPARKSGESPTISLSVPLGGTDTKKQAVLAPLAYLKTVFLRNGGSEAAFQEIDWSGAEVRRDGKEIPCQIVDVRGDGPGTIDDLLAFQLEPGREGEAKVTIVFREEPAKGVTSGTSASYVYKTKDLAMKNDRISCRIFGREGVIQSMAPAQGAPGEIQGALDRLRFSPEKKDKDIEYRSRVICSGPVVAGIELVHVGSGDLRVVRRLWLWTGEPFVREDVEANGVGVLYLVNRVQAKDYAGPTGKEDFSPDRELAASLKVGAAELVTALDETSLDTDGYLLERMSSQHFPKQVTASFLETRKEDAGVEQTLCLRGNIGSLAWAVGVASDGADSMKQIWRRINAPLRVDERSGIERSAYRVMETGEQVSAAGVSDGGMCSFYNLNALYPDLSGLAKPDIDEKGFLRSKGTRFVYSDGTPLPCFNGGSVEWTLFKSLSEGWTGPPVEQPGVEYVVDYLARTGENFVRWHHHDFPSISWISDEIKSTINPKALDIFHYFLYRCYQKGIRVNFDALLIARPFEYVLPNLKHCFGTWNPDLPENFVPLFNRQAIQMQKDLATNLLTSYNPYRKRKVVDDPTLAMVAIENERRYLAELGAGINRWNQLPEPYRSELTALWNQYLLEKYKNRAALATTWSANPLQPAEDPTKGTVPLPSMEDTKDRSRPDPRFSDGLEFVYWLHKRYLKEMYDHIRSIGFKGVIYSNGDSADLNMRRAAAEVLDATACAGYAGTMRLCGTYNPSGMPVADKPIINRECGPKSDIADSWWSVLPHVVSGNYLDQTYNFVFMTIAHGTGIDFLLPDETQSTWAFSGLAQNAHVTSAVSLMAGSLAQRFVNLSPPAQGVELGIPYDGMFYDERSGRSDVPHEVADDTGYGVVKWQPGRRTQVVGIPPLMYFCYWPLQARFFQSEMAENPNRVSVNLPLLPAGNYSKCQKAFLAQPLCRFDRYGRKEISPQAYFKSMGMEIGTATDRRSVGLVAGYVDTDRERETLYKSLKKMGYEPPVEVDEFGKVWRTADRTCELDMEKQEFFIDRPEIQGLSGTLEVLSKKVSGIDVQAKGRGTVWWIPWSPRGLERSMLIAAMDGKCNLSKPGGVGFALAHGRDVEVSHQGRLLFSIQAPQVVNVTIKAEAQDDIGSTPSLFVTPIRPLSNRLPIKITLPAEEGVRVYGCSADGKAFLEISAQVDAGKHQVSFTTPNRQDVSFYWIQRGTNSRPNAKTGPQ